MMGAVALPGDGTAGDGTKYGGVLAPVAVVLGLAAFADVGAVQSSSSTSQLSGMRCVRRAIVAAAAKAGVCVCVCAVESGRLLWWTAGVVLSVLARCSLLEGYRLIVSTMGGGRI